MKQLTLFPLLVCSALALAQSAVGALPAIGIENAFPALHLSVPEGMQEGRPVWMSEVSDGTGRFFILEQQGRIVIVKKGGDGSDMKVFMDIVDRHPLVFNEEGLLGLAFHPGFKTNHLFYVYYNQQAGQGGPEKQRRSVISEFKVSATDPDKADMASERIVLEVNQPYPNHKGGQISFGPDNYLYITLGDGGSAGDPRQSGLNLGRLLAKILRIDVNKRDGDLQYGIPSDNPFVNKEGARGEIWAYGLRNVWRFSWDAENGTMWGGEVGQDLWEEVNVIVKGGNYGWSVREAFHPFPRYRGDTNVDLGPYIDPIIEYPHNGRIRSQSQFTNEIPGVSITGGYVYRGKKYPALQGVYLYADYQQGTFYGLRYENGKMTEHAPVLRQPRNIASFAEDLDRELYALAFDGRIYHITVPPPAQ